MRTSITASTAEEAVQCILIVDHDAGVRDTVSAVLKESGYDVQTAAGGSEMARALARRPADLVVLDIMLPGEDGLSICRQLNHPDGPAVIVLSARGEESDRIIGLEQGADDYLAKPCSLRELLARVRAVLRRRRKASDDAALGSACMFVGWRLDLVRHELQAPDGTIVSLSNKEFALLRAFVERPQRLLSRAQLMDFTRGSQSEGSTHVQISRLRRKLDHGAGDQDLIRTVRGLGYIFDTKVSHAA